MTEHDLKLIECRLIFLRRRLVSYADSQYGINASKDETRKEVIGYMDAWIFSAQKLNFDYRWAYVMSQCNKYNRQLKSVGY